MVVDGHDFANDTKTLLLIARRLINTSPRLPPRAYMGSNSKPAIYDRERSRAFSKKKKKNLKNYKTADPPLTPNSSEKKSTVSFELLLFVFVFSFCFLYLIKDHESFYIIIFYFSTFRLQPTPQEIRFWGGLQKQFRRRVLR